MVDITALAILL